MALLEPGRACIDIGAKRQLSKQRSAAVVNGASEVDENCRKQARLLPLALLVVK